MKIFESFEFSVLQNDHWLLQNSQWVLQSKCRVLLADQSAGCADIYREILLDKTRAIPVTLSLFTVSLKMDCYMGAI